MKKTITILLTVLCIAALLVGCGASSEGEQALEKLIAANTTEALFAQHESVLATFALPDGTEYLVAANIGRKSWQTGWDDSDLPPDRDFAVMLLVYGARVNSSIHDNRPDAFSSRCTLPRLKIHPRV